jgi:preprotein translocase subunit SecG
MQTFWQYFFGIALFFTSLFLILLVLVQRGRGGGLAGALGGPGGQSAFGTKAGDTFTWVTAGTAILWIVLAMSAIKLIGEGTGGFGNISGTGSLTPAAEAPMSDEDVRGVPLRGDLPLGGAGGRETPAAPGGEAETEE